MTELSPRLEHTAFASLYDRIAPLVYGITRRMLRDPLMAEHVTRDVLVELWRQADRFDETRGSVETWATTVAHRRALEAVRLERRPQGQEARVAGALADEEGCGDTALDAAQRHNLHQALDGLQHPQRQAIQLAFLDGMTQREIASMLDVPVGTVRSRIRDGLLSLRDGAGLR